MLGPYLTQLPRMSSGSLHSKVQVCASSHSSSLHTVSLGRHAVVAAEDSRCGCVCTCVLQCPAHQKRKLPVSSRGQFCSEPHSMNLTQVAVSLTALKALHRRRL